MARPREHDEDTRRALLATAGALLRDEGPGALSIRRVAAAVGATTRAIYSLFGSKQGLIRALYREGFAGLDAELAAVSVSADPVADIHALGLAYRRSALAHPDLYDVMFACPLPEFEPDQADQALALGTLERLRQAVLRGIEQGRVDGDPDQRTLQLWALVHGLASLEIAGAPPGFDTELAWEQALDAMLQGLRPRQRTVG